MNGLLTMAADLAGSLRARPGRAIAAAAGLWVGWFGVALALAIAGGVRERMRQLTTEFGAHAAVLTAADPEGRVLRTRGSIRELRSAAPEARWSGVAPARVSSADGAAETPWFRTDEHLAGVHGWRLRDGRFLDPIDVAEGSAHAVATESAAAMAGWRVGAVVAATDGRPWRLVGILGAEGPAPPGVLHPAMPAVFVPWTAAGPPPGAAPDAVAAIHVAADDDATLRAAMAAAEAFDEAGATAPRRVWITASSLAANLRRWQRAVGGGVSLMAATCLLLGGAMLMALLSADVRARVPEIGLRRSLGATGRQIAALFVAEAAVITFSAAAAALAAARAASPAVAAMTDLPVRLAAADAAGLLLACAVYAAAFSWAPARAAARVPAAEALRND